uniref:Uncharacterized protein n=1 Tax=Vitrella brassicaformis TaxID=1169539 RepID=A0A7S1PE05_9ALVE|mmetsp:Transcript_5214/g.12281  ORF Transcript_5214/g.12281 Transcript_5214/m.12281 type:complete len:107 (+) Transcript_5214:6-326(+)
MRACVSASQRAAFICMRVRIMQLATQPPIQINASPPILGPIKSQTAWSQQRVCLCVCMWKTQYGQSTSRPTGKKTPTHTHTHTLTHTERAKLFMQGMITMHERRKV